MKKIIRFLKFIFYSYHVIPRGCYCSGHRSIFSKKSKCCPYWDKLDEFHYQENGYCHYLGYGDQEINKGDREFLNIKTGEIDKASEMPFGVGLLWDGCKECRVKDYDWIEQWQERKYIKEIKDKDINQ